MPSYYDSTEKKPGKAKVEYNKGGKGSKVMRDSSDNMKKYPSPSKQVNRPDPSEPKMVDNTKTQSVTAGEVNTDAQGNVVGKESKVKAAYGQTKGLLWYNYIK